MVGAPREAAPGTPAPSECLLWSSPVILTGGQIPNVLFNEEVGLWHNAGNTSGCLRGTARAGPHPPATTVAVGASCASWPTPQLCGQGMDLGSAVSPCPAYPATATWPAAPPPVRALCPAVLTILPPMALMCCCSVSQCLSCGSAAYCNKAARTELRTGDRSSPKSPLRTLHHALLCPPLRLPCSSLSPGSGKPAALAGTQHR